MKIRILCEGTTDLLLLQFVLQYKYGWLYSGFVENSQTNRLIRRVLVKDGDEIEINSCGGITKIPQVMEEITQMIKYSTRQEEMYQKVIIMIDHDTIISNREFLYALNTKLNEDFGVDCINRWFFWSVVSQMFGAINVDLYIKCVPDYEIGAIENVMLEALNVDTIEDDLINKSTEFIGDISIRQDRYLQRKSRRSKAIFNTYFSIRAPEEKYDERARILGAFDWKNNEVLNTSFGFLDFSVLQDN